MGKKASPRLGLYGHPQRDKIIAGNQKALIEIGSFSYQIGAHIILDEDKKIGLKVVAIIRESRSVRICDLTVLELEQCGFHGVKAKAVLIDSFRVRHIDIKLDSMITFTRWDDVREVPIEGRIAAQLQLALASADQVTADLNRAFRK